jgi:outer membrane protein assembly factor BamB
MAGGIYESASGWETMAADTVRIETDAGTIELVDEPGYSFGPADTRSYRFAGDFSGASRASSIHGVLLDGEPLAVLGRGGGATGVHERSLAYVDGLLYVAVGDGVACLEPRPCALKWCIQTDPATCFGVYFANRHKALISHGELEIARFGADGRILWQASGADIFTGPFRCLPELIEAVDWNGRVYRFDYADGRLLSGGERE